MKPGEVSVELSAYIHLVELSSESRSDNGLAIRAVASLTYPVVVSAFTLVNGMIIILSAQDKYRSGEKMLGEPVENHNAIANLLAAKFIARSDVKAIQNPDGSYMPRRQAFSREDLLAHIRGEVTYGHYMLNLDNKVKLIVFDIDIDKTARLPTRYSADEGYTDFAEIGCPVQPCKIDGCEHKGARDVWRARGLQQDDIRITQRAYLSGQLRGIANKLMRGVDEYLQVPTTMAYTGSKGVHVYAFTGLVEADLARVGQRVVFDGLGTFSESKGNNFFKHVELDGPEESYSSLTVEVFPKQSEITSEGFGNLVRLPLGKNRHNPAHPTFFMDARGNHGLHAIMRRDALDALQAANPWAGSTPR